MSKTLTGNCFRREQLLQSFLLDRLVFRYEPRIMREIAREMRAQARLVSEGASISYSGDTHKKRMTTILTALWTDTVEVFVRHFLGQQKSARKPEILKELNEEELRVPATELIDQIMAQWAQEEGSRKITQITETTRQQVRDIVDKGVREGLSEKQIAKLIYEIAPTKSKSRAQTISRTETHSAANATADLTAKSTGLDMDRRWVAAKDERTRDAHRRADGQTVGQFETFNVGGEELRFPGDPRGSAENVINCRCVVAYIVK